MGPSAHTDSATATARKSSSVTLMNCICKRVALKAVDEVQCLCCLVAVSKKNEALLSTMRGCLHRRGLNMFVTRMSIPYLAVKRATTIMSC
jgi:hypothetical protein